MGNERSAITRRKLSQPAKHIASEFSLDSISLDYGCGRGSDAKFLNIDKYDSHYYPTHPTKNYYFILCTYVLNVVDEETQEKILGDIFSLLKPEGKAFITVRRDILSVGGSFIKGLKRTMYKDM
jgi:hypothetical protein